MDDINSYVKGLQHLCINRCIKILEEAVELMPGTDTTTSMVLVTSITNHLDNLVNRTNIHINTINDLASIKL